MNALSALLDWYGMAGVDAAVAPGPVPAWRARAEPRDLSVPAPARPPVAAAPPATRRPVQAPDPGAVPALLVPESRRVGSARELARACESLEELEAALQAFDGCALRETASRLCFADGNPQAQVMVIGEAPGAEEDREGRPFVGQSGQLLDRILRNIGLDRTNVWITNVLYWRPPGNRPPTTGEIAVCLPFLERQIELLAPRFILFVGAIAAKTLLERTEGVTKLRGRPFTYRTAHGTEIPCLVTFHPAYLLRQPLNKRFVWRDMLAMRARLDELGVACGAS
ncbi:MAG TPA: uracil-DNA glycosylase [Geminicoccaceae bacterium]|jgi:DNA polymerase|nr:uracil-DNA glycosylase [Geminicoccaceae bacterium]